MTASLLERGIRFGEPYDTVNFGPIRQAETAELFPDDGNDRRIIKTKSARARLVADLPARMSSRGGCGPIGIAIVAAIITIGMQLNRRIR